MRRMGEFDKTIFREALFQIAGERACSRRFPEKSQGKTGSVLGLAALESSSASVALLFPSAAFP
jgi:hypothetical protein